MSDNKKIDSVRLQNIAQAYGQSAALMSGVELGLFTAVSKGADTIPKIAEALDIHPVNAERLTTMLTAMEVLVRRDGRYSNAEDAERFLVEGTGRYAGPWMLFTKPEWNDWSQLTERLRAKDLKLLGPIEGFTTEDARAYHTSTFSIGLGAGRRFSRLVDLGGRKRIMDVGGGSGAYCIAAVNAYPHLTAVVLDLAPVVTVAREFIADNGVADKVTAEACDFTADAFPTDCDLAIMASNLPMYGPETIAHVVKKVHDALLPGGEFHLIGETLNDNRDGPIGPAYWGLGQAIDETMGVAHSEADCIGYFEAAGFSDVGVTPFVEGSLSRIHGAKAD